MIHPTAIIHPKARVDPTVQVGPYAVIDEDVVVGPGCILGPHVYLTGVTQIGAGNRFFPGCSIGDAPQDLKYKGARSCVQIGDNNSFRENVTVHRGTEAGEVTAVGSRNLFMAGAHIAHNCILGNNIIIANGAMLGGHVVIEDRAVISGNCLVHQFVRVGTLAMMQGGSAISKDLAPYTVARGRNTICGLNIIGLRRAGLTPAERLEIKKLYRLIFRQGLTLRHAIEAAEQQFTSDRAREMLDFLRSTKRGICSDRRRAKGGSSDDSEAESD